MSSGLFPTAVITVWAPSQLVHVALTLIRFDVPKNSHDTLIVLDIGEVTTQL